MSDSDRHCPSQPPIVVLCPGFHDPQLSDDFIDALTLPSDRSVYQFPAHQLPPYSPFHIVRFIEQQRAIDLDNPLIFVGFSAGAAGAIGAAKEWSRRGGRVRSLVAIDGWGVPLSGDFAIYRLSHDRFTHETSGWLGEGTTSFYADPPVEHLDLWRSPDRVFGWIVTKDGNSNPRKQPARADRFLREILN